MLVNLVYLSKESLLGSIDLLYLFFLDCISFISALIFIISFLLLTLHFVCCSFQVPLSVKLDCLLEFFLIFWDRPLMLWISLLGLFSQCLTNFGLLYSCFHLFQSIFWFFFCDLVVSTLQIHKKRKKTQITKIRNLSGDNDINFTKMKRIIR